MTVQIIEKLSLLLQIATLRYDITDLMNILTDPGKQSYDWIKMRIQRMWPGWVKAIKSLAAKQVMTNISKKKVGIMILLTPLAHQARPMFVFDRQRLSVSLFTAS